MVLKTLIFLLICFVGCGNSNPFNSTTNTEEPIPLELYMDLPKRDGLYVFDYPNNSPHTYTSVQYQTDPMTRVFWGSVDTFVVYHMYHYFTYPIINYSTYSSGVDGSGKQMIYIYEPHIGDTLEIVGCITETNCKSIEFLVE